MKKHLLLLIGLLYSISIFAQEYRPFPTENALWRESIESWNAAVPFPFITDIHYETIGDTIINNLVYHKLYKVDAVHDPYSPNITYHQFNFGAFREDINEKKIYLYNYQSKKEDLLYDFNIHVGDTIDYLMGFDAFEFMGDGIPPIVTGIDSILLGDNLYHKRFRVEGCYGSSLHLIEGIGNDQGLMNGFSCYMESIHYFHCLQINGETIYYEYSPCSPIVMSIPDFEENDNFNIYPNPTQDYVMLEIGNNFHKYQSVTIFNLLGQKMMEVPIVQDKQTISTQMLQNGYYLIRINSDKENSLHKKLLIIK